MQHSRGNQIVMSPSGSKSTPIASPSGEKKEKKIEKKEEKKEETPK